MTGGFGGFSIIFEVSVENLGIGRKGKTNSILMKSNGIDGEQEWYDEKGKRNSMHRRCCRTGDL